MPEHDIPTVRGEHAKSRKTEGRDRPPFHIRLTKDREVTLDYRQAAVAAGAVGLGALAYTIVSTLFRRGSDKAAVAAGHDARTTAVPLAPSAALCNMTTCLQQQAEWISDCIAYMRRTGKTVCEATKEMEDRWVAHHDELASANLISRTTSWYLGSNVPGKPRRVLSYTGGVGTYRKKCDEVAASGYQGFGMR